MSKLSLRNTFVVNHKGIISSISLRFYNKLVMIEPLGEISNIESKKIFRAYAFNMTIGFYHQCDLRISYNLQCV